MDEVVGKEGSVVAMVDRMIVVAVGESVGAIPIQNYRTALIIIVS